VLAVGQVVAGVPPRRLLQKVGLVAPVDREDPTELGSPLRLRDALPGVQRSVLESLRVRVAALTEQVPHLCLGDLGAPGEAEVTEWATPHTFRRTVATLLDEAGLPIALAANQLGHSDPAMTARVYLGRKASTAAAAAVL